MLFSTCSISHSWINWAKNYECHGNLVYPQTKQELITIVANAACKKHTVRVVGSGHSLNDIACCDDLLISLKKLDRVLSIDKTRQQVTVEAGIILEDFNVLIAQHGLSLPNFTSVTEPTLGGIICTASHGTGKTGTLSSFITEIELITADGTLRTLSPNNDYDAFKAACVSLGTLGVIYSITMQCEPLFKVEYHTVNMKIDDVVIHYKDVYNRTDFFQFRWNPKQNIVIAEFWNRVPLSTPLSESVHFSFETLPCDKGKPYITEKRTTANGASNEIAIPVELLPKAITIIKELMQKWNPKHATVFYINGRFVQADHHTFLSPAGCDVVFLGMGTSSEEYQQEFEQHLYELGGRPHWGKKNFLNYEKALALYGDSFLKFIEVKKRLDPDNIFTNSYIDRILRRADKPYD